MIRLVGDFLIVILLNQMDSLDEEKEREKKMRDEGNVFLFETSDK